MCRLYIVDESKYMNRSGRLQGQNELSKLLVLERQILPISRDR